MSSFDRTVPTVHLHIGDEQRIRGGGGVHQRVYPATGKVQGPVPLAGIEDVDQAVQAAAEAFVLTGAGSGIGRATAISLASRGCRVVATDLDPDRAEETAALIEAAGGEAVGTRVDVSRLEDLEQITVYGEPTAPRAPRHPLVAPDTVGELVAEAITCGTFLVVTAPEIYDELRERAADPEAYMKRMIGAKDRV